MLPSKKFATPITSGSFVWSTQFDFDRLMRDVRDGSQDAAWELLERIGPHVERVVHKLLNRELRSKFDSMDFVQAVWASFFVNRREITTFTHPEQLIRFLVLTARNKVICEHRRRMLTIKHDVRRDEMNISRITEVEEMQLPPEPSPSQFAIARECWNQMIDGQPELNRQVVMRKYMGDTIEEIATALRVNRRTVTRILGGLLPAKSPRFLKSAFRVSNPS